MLFLLSKLCYNKGINYDEVVVMEILKKLFSDTEIEDNEYVEEDRKTEPKKPVKKVAPNGRSVSKGDVVLVEPLVYADAKDILDNIRAGKVLIINLTKLDLKTGDRLLDFVSGGIYALDAKLKTIGDEIYLCVPKGTELAGEFTEGEL